MRHILSIILIVSFVACKKDNIETFNGNNGITFYVNGNESDSMSYSFAYSLVEKQRDTIYLNLRILGAPTDHPRLVKVVAGPGSTARKDIDYQLPEFLLPAGAITAKYPVILLNSPELKSNTFRLVATLAESKDFVIGALGEERGSVANNEVGTKSIDKIKVDISSQFLMPTYWPDVESSFGTFSVTKFKFMIQVTGLTNFSYEAIGDDGIYNLPVKLSNALAAYESVNGPLIDESGNRVTF